MNPELIDFTSNSFVSIGFEVIIDVDVENGLFLCLLKHNDSIFVRIVLQL